MIRYIFINLFILYNFALFGQTYTAQPNVEKTSMTPTTINLALKDTLHIANINSAEKSSNENKHMPWIIALIIGVVSAITNLLIAYRLRQSNERNLNRQMENNKEITLTQFKGTIATKNRQEWINDLRHSTSEFISESIQITFELVINKGKVDNVKIHLSKLFYNKSKIEMLLNDSKAEQKELIDNVNEVFTYCLGAADSKTFDNEKLTKARDKTIVSARKLFGIHWRKIRDLQ